MSKSFTFLRSERRQRLVSERAFKSTEHARYTQFQIKLDWKEAWAQSVQLSPQMRLSEYMERATVMSGSASPPLPERHIEVLTPITSEYDLTWK